MTDQAVYLSFDRREIKVVCSCGAVRTASETFWVQGETISRTVEPSYCSAQCLLMSDGKSDAC